MNRRRQWAGMLAVAASLMLVGMPGQAQLQTGNLFGTVTDEAGAALPGVTATLTGSGAPAVQVTNAQGRFRFLSLGPGTYRLETQLEGFVAGEFPNISISIARNTDIEVVMRPQLEK